MGPVARLEINLGLAGADAHQAHQSGPARRLNRHRFDQTWIGLKLGIRDPSLGLDAHICLSQIPIQDLQNLCADGWQSDLGAWHEHRTIGRFDRGLNLNRYPVPI